jgi:uncharacterized Tic20 family protein
MQDGAAFCGNCGAAVGTAVPATSPGPEPAAFSWSQPPPQPPPQQQQVTVATAAGPSTAGWMMLCHLSALAGVIVPFANLVGPLIVWLTKRNEIPEVDVEGKEALNFQISMTIYFLVSAVLTVVIIGLPMMVAVGLFDLVMTIVASVKSSQGVVYRYPLTIRLIS